jgi:hypothetical protein
MEVEAEEVIIGEEVEPDNPTVKVVPIDADTFNFNFRQAFLETYTEANDGDTVICEVRDGVVIGSTSTSLPAFDTGSGWPSGISLKLVNAGIIAGKGGRGGDASSTRISASSARGGDGGLGFKARVSLTLDNTGIIGGGGGGSGGAAAYRDQVLALSGSAVSGSGGAGFGESGSVSSVKSSRSGVNGTLLSGGSGRSVSHSECGSAIGISTCAITSASTNSGGGLGQSGGGNSSASQSSTGASGGGGGTSVSLGGLAGNAIEGESLITWINEGDIRGNRV